MHYCIKIHYKPCRPHIIVRAARLDTKKMCGKDHVLNETVIFQLLSPHVLLRLKEELGVVVLVGRGVAIYAVDAFYRRQFMFVTFEVVEVDEGAARPHEDGRAGNQQ